MIDKILNKKIFISIFLSLLMGSFWVGPVLAGVPNLEVLFENEPLFDVGNFLPGDSDAGWIKVQNNTDMDQMIAIRAENVLDIDNLGGQINLIIKHGATEIYNNTFEDFFNQSQILLTSVNANGGQVQYDLLASIDASVGNDYKNKTMGFDFTIGIWDEDDNKVVIVTTGGGGGGSGPWCGNEFKDGNEECDGLSGLIDGYTCTNDCKLEKIVQPGNNPQPESGDEPSEEPGGTGGGSQEPELVLAPVLSVTAPVPAVAGDAEVGEVVEEPQPIVAGAYEEKPTCQTCAWWVWLLTLILHLLIAFVYLSFVNRNKNKDKISAVKQANIEQEQLDFSQSSKNQQQAEQVEDLNNFKNVWGWIFPVGLLLLTIFLMLWLVCQVAWFPLLCILLAFYLMLLVYYSFLFDLQNNNTKQTVIILLSVLIPMIVYVSCIYWTVWSWVIVVVLYALSMIGFYLAHNYTGRIKSKYKYWMVFVLVFSILMVALEWLLHWCKCS